MYNIDDNLVPAVLDGPRVQPRFQVAVREGSFKLVWGQAAMLHRWIMQTLYWKTSSLLHPSPAQCPGSVLCLSGSQDNYRLPCGRHTQPVTPQRIS